MDACRFLDSVAWFSGDGQRAEHRKLDSSRLRHASASPDGSVFAVQLADDPACGVPGQALVAIGHKGCRTVSLDFLEEHEVVLGSAADENSVTLVTQSLPRHLERLAHGWDTEAVKGTLYRFEYDGHHLDPKPSRRRVVELPNQGRNSQAVEANGVMFLKYDEMSGARSNLLALSL